MSAAQQAGGASQGSKHVHRRLTADGVQAAHSDGGRRNGVNGGTADQRGGPQVPVMDVQTGLKCLRDADPLNG